MKPPPPLLFTAILAGAVLLVGCTTKNRFAIDGTATSTLRLDSTGMSPQMRRIVSMRRKGEFDLSTHSLRELPWTSEFVQALIETGEFEIYKLPPPPATADYFQYNVLRSKPSGGYVIIVSGGIAGQFKVYGKGQLPPPPKPGANP